MNVIYTGKMANMFRTDIRLGLEDIPSTSPSAIGAQPNIVRTRKTSSLLKWLSVSKFPFRHPVLYGSLLELRSFLHRIQSLRKQGDILPLEIGLAYQQSSDPKYLVRNRRTQARSQGIQKLLSGSPWLSTEDCRLFLKGWDSAEELGKGSCIEENSVDGPSS